MSGATARWGTDISDCPRDIVSVGESAPPHPGTSLASWHTHLGEGQRIEPTDVTIQILRSIRDEVAAANQRIDGTNQRIDGTNDELRGLARRVVEAEVRTATAITDLHGTVRDLVDVLRDSRDLRPRVDRCERDIEDIKGRLEIR